MGLMMRDHQSGERAEVLQCLFFFSDYIPLLNYLTLFFLNESLVSM